jgi:hypothetical protein
MNFFKYLFLSFTLTISLNAYVDEDIDGVDDSIDQCLNTPFDALADEDGCSKGQRSKKSGKLSLKIGTIINFDQFSDKDTNINFSANYFKDNWNLSLSSSSYTNYNESNDKNSENGDIYLSGGYLFKMDNSNIKLSLGMKLATADDDVGTGEDDYFMNIFYDYFIDNRQDLFLYYGYTVSGDSKSYDYENFSSFSIGSGIALTNSWYSSISYDQSGSIYRSTEDYKALTWFNSYSFSKRFFTTFSYSYALDDISYENSISLKLGVNF